MLRAAFERAARQLALEVPRVDALNVFPVPDGDTGTNMSMTLQASIKEVATRAPKDAAGVAAALAHGALMGARGNSGVILSQILRGMARGLQNLETFNAKEWAQALREATTAAYKAVSRPVEGTMLTVIREAAEAANEAARTGRADLNEVMAATVAAAQQSLERTPMLLQVLRDAGVVDAGGQGLVIILEAIAAEWRGEAWQEPTTKTEALPRARLDAVESEFGYCTEFLIRGQRLNLDEIRERIGALGDSLLVVGDEQLVRVHVHTHDPGAALSYAVQRGDLLDIKIDNMQDQNERFRARQRDSLEAPAATVAQPVAPAPAVSAPVAASPASGRPMPRLRTSTTLERVKLSTGVVAVAAGPGLAEVFLSLGAHKVFDCGAAMNPSTEEMLTAIAEMDADVAIILPNNPNIVMTALQAQEHATKRVMVIPSKSMPQGIAAMMKYNPDRTASENEAAMRQAIENVRTIEVARAVRDARVDGTAVKAGEVMAVGDEGLLATAPDETAAIKAALARLDREAYAVATLYYGDSVDASTAQQLIGVLRETYPDLEFEAVWGGQPHYSYLIAVE